MQKIHQFLKECCNIIKENVLFFNEGPFFPYTKYPNDAIPKLDYSKDNYFNLDALKNDINNVDDYQILTFIGKCFLFKSKGSK